MGETKNDKCLPGVQQSVCSGAVRCGAVRRDVTRHFKGRRKRYVGTHQVFTIRVHLCICTACASSTHNTYYHVLCASNTELSI